MRETASATQPPTRSALGRLRDQVIGPCPRCGRTEHWYNDVPLRGSCWGPENAEHPEWTVLVPPPFNPYLSGYDPDATVDNTPPAREYVVWPEDGDPLTFAASALDEASRAYLDLREEDVAFDVVRALVPAPSEEVTDEGG